MFLLINTYILLLLVLNDKPHSLFSMKLAFHQNKEPKGKPMLSHHTYNGVIFEHKVLNVTIARVHMLTVFTLFIFLVVSRS